MKKHYFAFVHGEKGNYGVTFPDFPGCVTVGKTFEEVLRMAKEALAFHIEGMQKADEPIPEPTSIGKLGPYLKECEEYPVIARMPG